MKAFCVLYNPLSSTGTGENKAHKLDKLLEGYNIEYRSLLDIGDKKTFLRELDPDIIPIITGGDGTLSFFVNELGGENPERSIYYFPAGTGNVFLNDLNKTGDTEPFLLNPYIVDLPMIHFNGETHTFINGVGYGILRVNDAKGTRNLLLDYGPNRSHGHPDKLNIDLWAFGNLQIPDPGIVWYEQPIYRQWYRTTFAHNTLNVDMSEQEACGAELLVYAANNSVGMMRARTDQAYYGVMMDRTVVMTKDYIADLFGVSAISPRILDVTWHPRGNLVKTKTSNPADGSFNLSSPVGNGYNQLKGIKAWKGKSSFEAEFDNEGIKTRLITADDGEESTIVQGFADIPNNYREGNSSLKQYPIFVRRKTNETVFSAAFDYSNSSAIKSVKKLGSIEEGFGAMAILTDTTKDALVCSYRDAKVIKAYGIETDAQSAFVSRDASGRMIHAIMGGGTRLSAGKFELKASEKISVTIERTSKGYIVKNASPVDAKITVAVGGKSHRLNLKANAYSRPL